MAAPGKKEVSVLFRRTEKNRKNRTLFSKKQIITARTERSFQKNSKNGTLFSKEQKRTARTEHFFQKNGKERKNRTLFSKKGCPTLNCNAIFLYAHYMSFF